MDKPKDQNSSNGEDDENLALHILNDYCLLKVFDYLNWADARNLSRISERLKSLWMFRVRKLTFDFHTDMLSKRTPRGNVVLDLILMEYGAHIRSWQLSIQNKFKDDALELLRRVGQFSMNLKQLKFKGIKNMNFLNWNDPKLVEYLANVETLIFACCGKIDRQDVFHHFCNLKQLQFEESVTTSCNLQILFKNNPKIESLCFNDCDTFLGLESCEFGQNFDRLCLGLSRLSHNSHLQMDKLLRLTTTSLTKLKLDLPSVKNLGTFLAELAKQGSLEELELLHIKMSLEECMVIQSFRCLRLLVFSPKFETIDEKKASEIVFQTWPWSPVRLSLRTNIRIRPHIFAQMVNQIHLHRLHLEDIGDTSEYYIETLFTLLHPSCPNRILNLILSKSYYRIDCQRREAHPDCMSDRTVYLSIDFNPVDKRKIKSFAY